MAFIKVQKLVYGDDGSVKSGSAAIVDAVYGNFGSYHSKQAVREKLGKVVYLSPDKRSGVFLSPTRGLVEYDADSDAFQAVNRDDPRLPEGDFFPQTEIHTVFGDAFLLLNFLEKSGILSVLRSAFSERSEYERIICHLLHSVLRDGSKISCDNFISKSFASYILQDVPIGTLGADSAYFSAMGEDNRKMAFFREFVGMMQKRDPSFGKGCYVDSTPLPNDIVDNPFNALCCHGVASSEVMTRLVLVLDEASGLPVWYDIIPGNVLDVNTIMKIVNDVADSLSIEIESLVLDAGYVSRELVETFHIGTSKTIIGRMPARKGYPYKTLYWYVKSLLGRGKYDFVRKNHAYFGYCKKIELFGYEEFAYIYVDKYTALKRYSDYLVEHEEEYASLKDRDKDWLTVKYGYFVLLSNIDATPAELLSAYFGRTEIEHVFKETLNNAR